MTKIGPVLAIIAAVVLVVPAAASASHLNMSFAVVETATWWRACGLCFP